MPHDVPTLGFTATESPAFDTSAQPRVLVRVVHTQRLASLRVVSCSSHSLITGCVIPVAVDVETASPTARAKDGSGTPFRWQTVGLQPGTAHGVADSRTRLRCIFRRTSLAGFLRHHLLVRPGATAVLFPSAHVYKWAIERA